MPALSEVFIPAVLFIALVFITPAIISKLRVLPERVKVLSVGVLLASGLYAGYVPDEAQVVTISDPLTLAPIFISTLLLAGYGLLQMSSHAAAACLRE